MTTVIKHLDYNDLSERIIQLESSWVVEGSKRVQYSYCNIYTDTEIDFRKLGDIIDRKSREHITKTGKDYVSTRKKYLSISTNLLTRIYCDEKHTNCTVFPGDQYDSQFRSISKFGEYIPPVPFNIVIFDIRMYFAKQVEGGKNTYIIDTNNIVNGEKIKDLTPYTDIYNPNDVWIYNNKYHFDFQVDRTISKKIQRNYLMPIKLFNDIYLLEHGEKETNCSKCDSSLFGKYYMVKEVPVCRFCAHFTNQTNMDDEAIIFVDNNGLSAHDIGMDEVMTMTDFVKKNGYYTNQNYILYDGSIIDYIFSKNIINPTINGNTKKIILASIIEY